jgi:hypothetical protein
VMDSKALARCPPMTYPRLYTHNKQAWDRTLMIVGTQ